MGKVISVAKSGRYQPEYRHIIMIKPVSTGDNKKGDRLMKKKLRGTVVLLTTAALAASTLAGCGGSGKSDDTKRQTRNLQLLLKIPTGRELKKQLT